MNSKATLLNMFAHCDLYKQKMYCIQVKLLTSGRVLTGVRAGIFPDQLESEKELKLVSVELLLYLYSLSNLHCHPN